MRGCQDLLGGYVVPWQQVQKEASHSGSLPPRPPKHDLLPQAMMLLQHGGGTVKGLTAHTASYMNSKVLAEANRDRNMAGISLG